MTKYVIFILLILAMMMLGACMPAPTITAQVPAKTDPGPAGACLASTEAVACTIPTAIEEPAFAGTWVSGSGSILKFTANSFYYRFTSGKSVQEDYGVIQEVNTGTHQIAVKVTKIVIDGVSGGFDSPLKTISWKINGDQMNFAITDAVNPAEPVYEVFTKK
jgi:hypothetical protein